MENEMTITPEKQMLLKKNLIRWAMSVLVVGSLLYFQSSAPIVPVVLGILGTLIAVIITTLFWTT
jgi:hypothetical protein